MERTDILTRLLDKFENSQHLTKPGTSNRRVMLRIEKNELPSYQYEIADVRDKYNAAARQLAEKNLVEIQWVPGRPVMKAAILNLDAVEEVYQLAGRVHPAERVKKLCIQIEEALSAVRTPWIVNWKIEMCRQMRATLKIPAAWRADSAMPKALLVALAQYDRLQGEPVTMRTFSSLCYHDTKYFERQIREPFLRVAQEYAPELAEACENEDLNPREKLAVLGIYARPELYEMAGPVSIKIGENNVDLSPFSKTGIGIPSTAVPAIAAFDLQKVSAVIFIENKTNYDEFLLCEAKPSQLVVYHGGFLSPQKRNLMRKLYQSATPAVNFFFWADIDLGGFLMFERLQQSIPSLQPMRMSQKEVIGFEKNGLHRSEEYLARLREDNDKERFPLFKEAIDAILQYGVTIEQEIFLAQET